MLPIGKEIYYLHICRRKLWLFNHGIRPEMENDHVRIGMLIQQTSFSREKKEIPIGEIGVLDWADFKILGEWDNELKKLFIWTL